MVSEVNLFYEGFFSFSKLVTILVVINILTEHDRALEVQFCFIFRLRIRAHVYWKELYHKLNVFSTPPLDELVIVNFIKIGAKTIIEALFWISIKLIKLRNTLYVILVILQLFCSYRRKEMQICVIKLSFIR